MKNKKSFFTIIVIVSILLVLGCSFFVYGYCPGKNMSSLFSWKENIIYDESTDNLNYVIDTLEVGRLFQCFDKSTFETDDINTFLDFLHSKDVDVYYLTGEASWATDDGAEKMKEEIDFVYEWNQTAKKKRRLGGIVFDVEPYTLDDWGKNSNDDFIEYIEIMKEAYNYASDKNISVIACIPYWFDNDYELLLELFIRDCCDEIAIMNYDKGDEFENIENELAMAKKYKKGISSIFEFIEPGKHELEEKNTYHNDGIQAAQEAFEILYQNSEYRKFYSSYHYFEPIWEILSE